MDLMIGPMPTWTDIPFRAEIACFLLPVLAFLVWQWYHRSPNSLRPPRYHHLDPFGYDLFFKRQRSYKEGNSVKLMSNLFRQYGPNFEAKEFGTVVTHTADPQVMQAIFSTSFDAFELGPVRKAGRDHWLGPGILTSDGEEWREARMILKPVFHRASISDLTCLEKHIDRLIKDIPAAGETVDLQVKFQQLVCPLTAYSIRDLLNLLVSRCLH